MFVRSAALKELKRSYVFTQTARIVLSIQYFIIFKWHSQGVKMDVYLIGSVVDVKVWQIHF